MRADGTKPSEAKARATELASGLAELSPVAIAEIKRAVYQGSEMHLEGGLTIESDAFMRTMHSDEGLKTMQEYVALPFEKRRDWLERRTATRVPRG